MDIAVLAEKLWEDGKEAANGRSMVVKGRRVYRKSMALYRKEYGSAPRTYKIDW